MLPHWTQNDLLVNGVRLHYYRTGQGDKRPLVLVHGFSDNGLLWLPTARQLESEYDVILPDMRGHGLSARVQPDEKVDMAADLACLIRTLGLERPIVGGHSMGEMVTYQIGTRFPELSSALILEDPPWWLNQPVEAPFTGQPAENPMTKWVKSLPSLTMEELLTQCRKDHPNWPEETVRLMCASKKQLDPTILDTMVGRLQFDWLEWQTSLQNITQPVLLITANPALGAIVTPQAAARALELNPKVINVNIPDVGHLIRFDKFEVFMQALWVFLKEIQ